MADENAPLRLVVLGDSLAFTDDRGPQLPAAPALYPSIAARLVEDALLRSVEVNVIARPGSDVREAWRAVIKDRHVQFEVLMGADAVVIAVGSFDHAPASVPAWLDAVVPFVRPARARRAIRRTMRAVHPAVVRLTRARMTRTPAEEFARLYDAVLLQVRGLTHGAAGVVLGPTSHRSAYYGMAHPQLAARQRIHDEIARRHGFPIVQAWPLVEPYAGRLNPDGIHWPAEVHASIGEALAGELVAQLRDDAPRPPLPWAAKV